LANETSEQGIAVEIMIMGPLMFFAGAFLAIGRVPPANMILLGFIAVYALTSAEHTIDDFIDKEIDKKKWPQRPLPTETISRWIFNWQLVVVELIALGLGTIYPFLRDRIGYLILSPIPALIGLGGWVAYSPHTLFTSPVPWLLYIVFATWQAFHILTLPWALTVAKIFVVRPEPRYVAIMSVMFSVMTLLSAVLLSLYIENSFVFVLVMIVISLLFWSSAVPLVRDPTKTENSYRAVMAATNYNIIMCAALMWAVI
jgi:4-hydroxybenzoate polyprenyltransferase